MRSTKFIAAIAALGLLAAVPAAEAKPAKQSAVRCHVLKPNGKKAWTTKCPRGKRGAQGRAGINGANGVDGVNGKDGATGATGPQGAKGDTGQAGLNGVSGYEVRTWDYFKSDDYPGAGNSSIATVACSPGKVATGGGYWIRNHDGVNFLQGNEGALGTGAGVVASFPGRMDWSTNTPKPNRNDGWIVQFNGNGPTNDVTLYVICVNAA